jgi:hypothetical protein
MEIIKFILSLAFGIIVLLIFKYIMSFITGSISKFFGTTSTLNGRIVATPDTLDENIKELKEFKNKFIAGVNKFKEKSKVKSDLHIREKIKLLVELEQLKKSNSISDLEYNTLREQIISKTSNSRIT